MTDPEPRTAALALQQTPGPRLAVATVATCFACFITLGAATSVLNAPFGLWFTAIFVVFGVAWELTRYSGRAPARYTGIDRPAPMGMAIGVLLGAVNFFCVAGPLQLISKRFLDPLLPAFMKQDASYLFDSTSSWELVLVVLAVVVAAPISEELAFRGVMQQGLAESGKPLRALIVTSIVFSAFHLDGVGFFARVELGALFGALFYATRSVWPGILAHATNNGVSVVLFLVSGKSEGPESAPPTWQWAALTAVGGALFILGLGRSLLPVLRRTAKPAEDSAIARPSSLWPAVARWVGAAALSVALLVAVDHRGIQLYLEDVTHPIPGKAQTPAEHTELQGLRTAARRGQVPVKDYEARHRAIYLALHPQSKR